jgi:hypothetical protein
MLRIVATLLTLLLLPEHSLGAAEPAGSLTSPVRKQTTSIMGDLDRAPGDA